MLSCVNSAQTHRAYGMITQICTAVSLNLRPRRANSVIPKLPEDAGKFRMRDSHNLGQNTKLCSVVRMAITGVKHNLGDRRASFVNRATPAEANYLLAFRCDREIWPFQESTSSLNFINSFLPSSPSPVSKQFCEFKGDHLFPRNAFYLPPFFLGLEKVMQGYVILH